MILFPDLVLDTIFDLNIDILHEKKIKGLIIDIDNTLVGWDIPIPDEKVINWLSNIKNEGIKVTLVSNNSYERVSKFNESLNYYSLHDAKKPLRKSYLKAIKHMGIKSNETAVIGDQIFTDVLGGNRLKMFTILVTPITDKEFPFIKVKRFLEKTVFFFYNSKRR